jgi:hypothetical protein
MNINAALLMALSLPTTGGLFTIAYHQYTRIKRDTSITYHTHAEQMVHSDGSDVNTDFDAVK